MPGVLAAFFQPSSYLGLFMFLALTGCGLPLPEEVALVLAGVLSNQGVLRPEFALASCILGTLAGDTLTYSIGYHWGRNLVEAHPRLSKLLHAENGKKFEAAVNSHAFKVMLISRFIIGVRASVYLTAGVVRIPYRRFLMYDLVCVSVMVSTIFFLAYSFGDDVLRWVRRAEWTATGAVVAVIVVVGIVLYRRRGAVIQALLDQESSGGS
jgi:membrane protein DedA with SNARE-associated domain